MRFVKLRLVIQSDSNRITDAFLEADMLQGWWGVERSLIEKKAGGTYALTWNITDQGFGYVTTGIIREYIPGKKLAIDNYTYFHPQRSILGPMQLSIEVNQLNDRESELHLIQSGYHEGEDWDWYYEAVKGAWPIVSEGLKKYLENK